MQLVLSDPSDERNRFNSVGNEHAGMFAQISTLTSLLVTTSGEFCNWRFYSDKDKYLYPSKL